MKKTRGPFKSPICLLPVQIKKPVTMAPESNPDLCLQFPSGTCLRFIVGTSTDYVSRLASAMLRGHACW